MNWRGTHFLMQIPKKLSQTPIFRLKCDILVCFSTSGWKKNAIDNCTLSSRVAVQELGCSREIIENWDSYMCSRLTPVAQYLINHWGHAVL